MQRQLRVYVAGSSSPEGLVEARRIMALLCEAGYVITFDWTKDVEENRAKGVFDVDLSRDERARYAREDRRGVQSAHVTVYVTPPAGVRSEGAAWELGFAEGLGRLTVVYGDSKFLFAALAEYQASTDAELLDILRIYSTGGVA